MNARDILTWLSRHVAPGANLCLDTRQLTAGDVFFACPGLASDGRAYIEQAVRQGAAAIVAHAPQDSPGGAVHASVPVLEVEDLPELLGQLAHRWYGEPSSAMSVVALTGTNGKTSCVQWLASALNTDGVPCGTIGTLGVTLADGTNLGGALTTPDVLTMHRSLAAMRKAGVQVVAIEASSIGLTQGRLDHVQIQIAGFTNLTHDHLDYHHSMEEYKAAKFRLFDWPGLRCSVINLDDAAGEELAGLLPASSVAGYSVRNHPQAALRAQDIQAGPYGLVFNLVTPEGTAQMLTRLVGEHNVSNLLQVAGVLRDMGWDLQRIARVLGGLTSVEGRLQVVEAPESIKTGVGCPMVVVDYAHTPDALERALRALRDIASARGGKLVCVFGCGGSRDSSKRPVMGRIAAEHADAVILTSDNPRSEDPAGIAAQIIAGMPQAPQVDLDRASAILSVIWGASSDDVVLIAGKGHETYQETQGVRVPFDDREWARFALSWKQGLVISTDTRSLAPGQLFVAIRGDTFDGHDYLEAARAAGACAAVVERKQPEIGMQQFELGDTRQALIRISTVWRRQFGIPAIAVAGSNGKTTTKEMIASILRHWLGEECSLATRGNLNNDIGVPLTVLRLTARHEAAVIELGMNHPGEIAVVAAVAQPTVALVNNAQREHQEFLHTVEAVARENGSVFDALPKDGTAVFPGDDTYTAFWTKQAAGRKTLRFGFERGFDVYADQIHVESDRTSFQIHTPAGAAGITLAAPGVHNLRNALAAAACTLAAGAPLQAVAQGLEAFHPVRGRMQPRPMAGGFQLIDDTYNANPDSVRAAIDVLAQLKGKKVLVLGDMGELGADSHALHAEVGGYAKDRGIDALLVHGVACVHAARAFGAQAFVFESLDELLRGIAPWMPAHVLVKGSRSARMERVVAALAEQAPRSAEGGHHAA
ncbi:bifunctional UDP-N-acetylmuramoyl-L-alanyl-D-glutamate--2,6-diaminopimelate ligase MurE/UDP-N-acetylmuramoyl-tripeptide--D-alanyl-D-alanine ligase MurF [Parapusillimonas sp. JC17]|uniref:bifunctional UDP-N-acetylmuramoyl-L-alanyl-D-glutamate--2, 6-diaminopimelate ligase MurE/UDP-N-acetylmuramoyl-tripeptide--D-alanyl-D-alanine ligase MurF n=1 Tax=Parapusillimonas sp. JC17 TaxID=3445768 RepID=UPI003F9F34D7